MGSINQKDNENEKYTLHFIFHTNITYQIFMDTCNEKYQNNISSYGETTDHTKHHT